MFLLLMTGACGSLVSIFIEHAYHSMQLQMPCCSMRCCTKYVVSVRVEVGCFMLPNSSGPKGQCQGRRLKQGKARQELERQELPALV